MAMIGIGLSKEKAKEFIPLVEDAITNKKFNTKPEAAYTLAMIGGSMETAVDTLVKSMANPTDELSSLEKLKALGEDAKAALPAITELLDSDDDFLRALAIEAIAEIGPSEQHAKRFKDLMKNSEFRTARTARIALEKK
jgi:HEAT repeat protein